MQKVVKGWWTIDTISFKNDDVFFCMMSNSLFFENGSCKMPVSYDACPDLNSYNEKGTWNISRSDSLVYFITFTTTNELFNGTHKLRFLKDEKNSLLKVEISSNKLYLMCRKALFNYQSNIKTIDNLVDITNP